MTKAALMERSDSKCELCGSTNNLEVYAIPPDTDGGFDKSMLACEICRSQINRVEDMDTNHWRCLNDSMWSEIPAVQVMAWRLLNRLRADGWPGDLLDMMYLDEYTLEWAKATGEGESSEDKLVHIDSNGNVLQSGDTVVLIQDLKVKGGGNFTAKRGTAVRRITLVHDNAEHIEGKVEGQRIVILTKYVKKS